MNEFADDSMTEGPGLPTATVRLLLVEDNARIRRALGQALADVGFHVVAAASGEQALDLLAIETVDVVLLDLKLPNLDGLSVCRIVRAQGDLPIIIITARSDTADVIEGLEAGADDYMTKPLVAGELVARIRALLRRRAPQTVDSSQSTITTGHLTIDLNAGEVTGLGERVHLTRTEFRLLAELASAGGQVVSREDLLQRVWAYDYFGDTRLLDVHIRRLRRKVELDPAEPVLLLTVRGVGYRLGGLR